MEEFNFVKFIISCLKEVISERGEGAHISLEELNEATELIGRDSILDSLSLVSLLVDVEQKLFDQMGISVTIADERAMSRDRSPFLTVGSLAEYVQFLIAEKKEP